MANRIFDTSYLIRHWDAFPKTTKRTTKNMRSWAEKFIAQYGSRRIVTPVVIEMVAGATSSDKLKLTHAYLDPFEIVDEGKIPKGDWDEAKRIAQRVPPDGRNRHLGDCLIRAIANRFNCDVLHTLDKNFPGR
jgi:predicted nucleic acid-binding protein